MRETWVRSLSQEDPLGKEMATHSSTLAWKIPWMEEPGRPQVRGIAMSWTRLSDFTFTFTFQYLVYFKFFFFSSKERTYKGGLHRCYFWVTSKANPPSHLCQNCDYMICLTNPQCLLQAAMWHCSALWDMSQSLQKVSSHVLLALEKRYVSEKLAYRTRFQWWHSGKGKIMEVVKSCCQR